jgi:hypothetical protein
MRTYHSIILKDETARNDGSLIQHIMDENINIKIPRCSPSYMESVKVMEKGKILTARLIFKIDAIFKMMDSPVPDRYVM